MAARQVAEGPQVARFVPLSLRQVKACPKRAATQHAHQTLWQLEGMKKQAAWYAAITDYQPLNASQQRPRCAAAVSEADLPV